MDHLTDHLCRLGDKLDGLTCAIKSIGDADRIIDRIGKMESRILSAIQGAKDAELSAMTKDLEKSSGLLSQAITDSKQPTEKIQNG